MISHKFGILILGLGVIAGSARASITYSTTQANFNNKATTNDGLTVSSPITFTGALTELGGSGVADDEYIDPTTGVEFLAFNSSGSSNVAFASVTSGVLNTQAGLGSSIEVIFPTGVDYGFAFNFTTAWSGGENLCIDPNTTFNSCASGGTYIASGGSGFIGAINDNPTPAPLTSVWLALSASGSAGTDLQNFEVAGVPEGSTNLLIGSGLIGIYLLHRRRRQKLPA
jgi:hypothetical protein